MKRNVLASTLTVGDVVDYYGRGNATILRESEHDTHPLLGDNGYFKFWAVSETGVEGYLRFGPTGRIDVVRSASVKV
ncbi:Uncharacterised protein [Mycobacteroides abscessus subsp. abscessus]|nr:Uncharacterised protein [Mycobacteroides abscessus subsp. abscessus]SID79737.1 Uncharacterised protein [Mycobacteroides abscessus subsp. abscessus]SIE29224.1 Uncharacterised protein [Mycobacteroides abscessus subsp. abscessus]SIJ63572.1 Uncharacterised protein [Mycobacteroides abscessus subsp. abscessus]